MRKKNIYDDRGKNKEEFSIVSESAIRDYLAFCPDKVRELACPRSRTRERDQLLADSNGTHIVKTTDDGLKGLVAKVRLAPLGEAAGLEGISQKKPRVLIALDHITDPHNLGAIVRSAAFYHTPWVIVAKDRQVLMTDASVAISQGGFSRTNLIVVTNLVRFLKSLKELGYWIVGADGLDPKAHTKKPDLDHVVLLMGNESKGISPAVKKQCDLFMKFGPSSPGLDSLNVSVATGIALQTFLPPETS